VTLRSCEIVFHEQLYHYLAYAPYLTLYGKNRFFVTLITCS